MLPARAALHDGRSHDRAARAGRRPAVLRSSRHLPLDELAAAAKPLPLGGKVRLDMDAAYALLDELRTASATTATSSRESDGADGR